MNLGWNCLPECTMFARSWLDTLLNIITIGAYDNIRMVHTIKEMTHELDDAYKTHPDLRRIYPSETSTPTRPPLVLPPPRCVIM